MSSTRQWLKQIKGRLSNKGYAKDDDVTLSPHSTTPAPATENDAAEIIKEKIDEKRHGGDDLSAQQREGGSEAPHAMVKFLRLELEQERARSKELQDRLTQTEIKLQEANDASARQLEEAQATAVHYEARVRQLTRQHSVPPRNNVSDDEDDDLDEAQELRRRLFEDQAELEALRLSLKQMRKSRRPPSAAHPVLPLEPFVTSLAHTHWQGT